MAQMKAQKLSPHHMTNNVNDDDIVTEISFTNGVGGNCTAKDTFEAAKTANPKYFQAIYCSVFKRGLTALIGLPENSPFCKRGISQYGAIHIIIIYNNNDTSNRVRGSLG